MPALSGKCALVTGSTRGLGLAAAERLATAGSHIVLNGIESPSDVSTIRDAIQRHSVRTLYCNADLRRPEQIERMMATAIDAFGSVDVLVNNAVVRHTAPVESFDVAQWDEGIAVNVSAAFHTIRLALPRMKQNRWGRIVNVSSIYGLRGAPNRVAYVTSKTALVGLTRAVAMETVADGITCNAVCPGTSDTPIHRDAIERMMADEGLSRADAERRFFAGRQPTARFVGADSVAALIEFLCGTEAADITGSVMPIDGGWSAG